MSTLPYTLDADDPDLPPIGMIVLQTDETLEPEFRHSMGAVRNPIYVSRIANATTVTTETLGAMEADLAAAAALLPGTRRYPVVGYGCTSASSVIGSEQVEAMVKRTCDVDVVTNPLRAATACAAHLGVSRFAVVSPYIEEVNVPLRAGFARAGISTEVFGTFAEGNDSNVVRISTQSVVDAAVRLGADTAVDAVFLSCTNLRTQQAIPLIEAAIGKPVLSSNQALAWHLRNLIGA